MGVWGTTVYTKDLSIDDIFWKFKKMVLLISSISLPVVDHIITQLSMWTIQWLFEHNGENTYLTDNVLGW